MQCSLNYLGSYPQIKDNNTGANTGRRTFGEGHQVLPEKYSRKGARVRWEKLMKKNFWKNKLGYTLGEIVMTTAIIGSLAAIAVPNFLRIKMNVNMELVKQQLRILGQNMNELYNQNNPHQYPEDINNLDGNPPEELSITASLNAIDNMGYSDHRWQTVGSPPNDFSLRRCPGEGLFGIAGDRCFLLTPSELTEVMPWDGTGMDMIVWTDVADGIGFQNFAEFLTDPNVSQQQKAELFAAFLEYLSYNMRRYLGELQQSLEEKNLEGMPAVLLEFPSGDIQNLYETLFPKVHEILADRGISIFNKTVGNDPIVWPSSTPGPSPQVGVDDAALVNIRLATGNLGQVGFEFRDTIDENTARVRMREAWEKLISYPMTV